MKTKLSLCLLATLMITGSYTTVEAASWFQNYIPRHNTAVDVMTFTIPTKSDGKGVTKPSKSDKVMDELAAKMAQGVCDQIYSTENLVLIPEDGIHTVVQDGPFLVKDAIDNVMQCDNCAPRQPENGSTIKVKNGDIIKLKLLLSSQNFGPSIYKQLSPTFSLQPENYIGGGVAINGEVPFPRTIYHSGEEGKFFNSADAAQWVVSKDPATGDTFLTGKMIYYKKAAPTNEPILQLPTLFTPTCKKYDEYLRVLVNFGACSKIGVVETLKFAIEPDYTGCPDEPMK